jgi:hypothetical protein
MGDPKNRQVKRSSLPTRFQLHQLGCLCARLDVARLVREMSKRSRPAPADRLYQHANLSSESSNRVVFYIASLCWHHCHLLVLYAPACYYYYFPRLSMHTLELFLPPSSFQSPPRARAFLIISPCSRITGGVWLHYTRHPLHKAEK